MKTSNCGGRGEIILVDSGEQGVSSREIKLLMWVGGGGSGEMSLLGQC